MPISMFFYVIDPDSSESELGIVDAIIRLNGKVMKTPVDYFELKENRHA
jgi:hypothetical protein